MAEPRCQPLTLRELLIDPDQRTAPASKEILLIMKAPKKYNMFCVNASVVAHKHYSSWLNYISYVSRVCVFVCE